MLFRNCFFVFLLLLGLVFSFLLVEMPVVRASDFAGGSGTAGSPYQISNWTHLNNVRDYLDKYFILTADLDSSTSGYNTHASSSANEGAGWIPIGDDIDEFTGDFDGNDKTISDLFIDTRGDYAGLFGYAGMYSYIGYLNLVDFDITSEGDYVGSLAGYIAMGFCEYISCVGGHITSTGNYVGGLAGYIDLGRLRRSYASVDIIGNNYVGGIVGYVTAEICGTDDCYAMGDVTGNDYVGGLVGARGDDGGIWRCYSIGKVVGNTNVGGLIGHPVSQTDILACFWDNQTSGQTTSAGGTGKNTTDMKTFSTFDDANWDIEYTNTSVNDGYPALGWQVDGSSIWVITYISPDEKPWSIMEYTMRGYISTLGPFAWILIFTAIIAYTYLKNQSVVAAAAIAIILIAAFSNVLIGVEMWVNLMMILCLMAFTGLIVYFIIKQRGG